MTDVSLNEAGGLPADLVAQVRQGAREAVAAALAAEPALLTAVDDDGMTVLHLAVSAGQPALVADLLAYPAVPLDAPQHTHGRTPLHIAARKGCPDVIQLLLDAGANVFAKDTRGERPLDLAEGPAAVAVLRPPTLTPDRALREAILSGAALRIHRQLAANPALLTSRDAEGRTLLHLAIVASSLPVLGVLLTAGVPVNMPDNMGSAPLHDAARRGDAVYVQVLLAAGAAPRLPGPQEITPLHLSAGHGDAARTLALRPPPGLAPPSDPALTAAPDGQCAFAFDLPVAVPTPPTAPTPQRHDLTIAAALLDAGADPGARARGGITPLHLAADLGDTALVTLLLARRAPVDPLLALWHATPAHLAATSGHLTVVTLLRQAGANLAARDNYGRTVQALLEE